MTHPLSVEEKQTLLLLARRSMESAVRGQLPPTLDLAVLSGRLKTDGASFVTLTLQGELRGCIGTLEARQPLALDVCEHSITAALHDPRFLPVTEDELKWITIEVSRLTAPQELHYASSDELISVLRPHVDGVILKDDYRRATFLPQVWHSLPDPVEFLRHLCRKMGAPADLWREKHLQVCTYQVEEFQESHQEGSKDTLNG